MSISSSRPSCAMSQDEHERLMRQELVRLNRENGVIESVEDLRGWHLVHAELWKRGVYRIMISRYLICGGAEMLHGFASQTIITTAREIGYLSASNGFILPD